MVAKTGNKLWGLYSKDPFRSLILDVVYKLGLNCKSGKDEMVHGEYFANYANLLKYAICRIYAFFGIFITKTIVNHRT